MRTPNVLSAAVLAVACLSACRRDVEAPDLGQRAEATPAGPGVRALLDGLKEGDTLGDLRVDRVLMVWEGTIRVDTSDETGRKQRLVVTLVGDGPLPPATSKKYAVYFGSAVPDAGAPPPPERVTKAVEALAERLKKTEDSVAMPAGMRSYGAVRTAL